MLLLLFQTLAGLSAVTAASLPFRVYEPCADGSSAIGMCRREVGKLGGVVPATVPTQLPVDMRLPCTDDKSCRKVSSKSVVK